MYCVICGHILPENVKFCMKCGAPQKLKPLTAASFKAADKRDAQKDVLMPLEAEPDVAEVETEAVVTRSDVSEDVTDAVEAEPVIETEPLTDETETHVAEDESYVIPEPVTENETITEVPKKLNPGVNDEFGFGSDSKTGEPVSWKVLAVRENKALIISSDTVFEMPYNQTDGSFSWQDCTLRKYLNGTFLDEYFTQEERDRIVPCIIVNDETYDLNASAGDSAADRVFLLSAKEAKNYFPDNESRAAGKGWWLRYARRYAHCSPSVDEKGIVHPSFDRQRSSEGTGAHGHGIVRGIRPAMWIVLDV